MTGTAQAAGSTAHSAPRSSPGVAGSTRGALRVRLWPFPVHPLLVAIYPILLAYADNLAEVRLSEVSHPILGALAVAVATVAVAALVTRDLRRGALIASVLLALWFAWRYILMAFEQLGAAPVISLAVIVSLGLVTFAGAIRLPDRVIARITSACNLVAILMVSLALLAIVPHEMRARPAAVPAAERAAPAPGARDVWFLVFDRYGSERAMQHAAGVDNDLPEWLEDQGFFVARDARANYGRTSMSLAATLGMTYLDALAAEVGPDSDDAIPLTDMLQDPAVGRFFQKRGYRFVQVGSWFGPTRTSAIADENPVLPGRSDFADNVLRAASIRPLLDRVIGSGEPPANETLHREAALFDWAELERLSTEDSGPRFVLGHVLLPHEPYVFRADGSYTAGSIDDPREAHREQLAYTNGRIRSLVSRLLDVPPDERPIIIVAADEGPYPDRYHADQDGFDWATATPDELATKYGVLQAMYLPGDTPADAPAPYQDMSVINTFPIVLDRYFGQDIPLFEDRSFSSRSWDRPYDLAEITERLTSIGP
ncbi:MAG: hypothetical protein ABWZ82_08505 [Candidatus Limnocylindrales bacterium]